MATITLNTPSISCMSCMATIEDALLSLHGVGEAEVDLATKQVRVTFDETSIDTNRIAAVITGAGYEVEGVS